MPAARASFAQQILKIRPNEGKRTGFAFVYLFAVVGSFIISRIARTTLFLQMQDYKQQLPLTYLGIAFAVSGVMYGYARVERRLRRDRTNSITLVLLIVITLVFRVALMDKSSAVYWAYFIWVEVFGTLLIVQFWSLATEIFHARQAKRLFAVIGGGGVLANVAVGFGVQASVHYIGTENLLLAICVYLIVALAMLQLLGREANLDLTAALQRPPAAGSRARRGGASGQKQGVFATHHVRLIAAVVVLTYLVSTLVDYQFNVIVADAIPGIDARSAFFGAFFGITGVIGGFVQFFGTARLLERLGILSALLLLPCAMFCGSLAILTVPLLPALFAATCTKGAENILRYTVNDATLQLLYLPVPAQVRGRAKALIDGILKPLSIGGAGLALALLMGQFERLTGLPLGITLRVTDLSWVVGTGLGLWIFCVWALRREYLESLVQTLRKRRLNFADARFRIADESTLKTLAQALQPNAPIGDLLNALELASFVAAKQQEILADTVANLLQHASGEVRVAALTFLQRVSSAHGEKVAALLEDDNPQVRAAAAVAHCAIQPERALVRVPTLLSDPHVGVRAAAIAGLIRHGGLDGVLSCADVLKNMLVSDVAAERAKAAWVLGEVGVQNFYQPLLPLLNDPVPEVCCAAIVAAERLKSPGLVAALVEQLARPRVGATAVAALAAFAEQAVEAVAPIVQDDTQPARRRTQACRVLARVANPRSVQLLFHHTNDHDDAVRSAAVWGLRTVARHKQRPSFDRRQLAEGMRLECQRWYGLVAMQVDLGLRQDDVLLTDALEQRLVSGQERILGFLSLRYVEQPIDLISSNLQSTQRDLRANAVEILDNVLDKSEKVFILPLFDDVGKERQAALATELFQITRHDPRTRLRHLLRGEDSWLRSCAAFTICTRALADLSDEVDNLCDADEPVTRETAIHVLWRLSQTPNQQTPWAWHERLTPLLNDPDAHVRRYANYVAACLGSDSNGH